MKAVLGRFGAPGLLAVKAAGVGFMYWNAPEDPAEEEITAVSALVFGAGPVVNNVAEISASGVDLSALWGA